MNKNGYRHGIRQTQETLQKQEHQRQEMGTPCRILQGIRDKKKGRGPRNVITDQVERFLAIEHFQDYAHQVFVWYVESWI